MAKGRKRLHFEPDAAEASALPPAADEQPPQRPRTTRRGASGHLPDGGATNPPPPARDASDANRRPQRARHPTARVQSNADAQQRSGVAPRAAVPARQNALSSVSSELLPEPIAGPPEAGGVPASSAAHQPAVDEVSDGGMEGLVLGAANGAEDAVPARQNALSPVPSELLPEPIAGVPEAGDPASSAAHQPADGEVFDGGMEGLVLGAANGAANGAVDADDGRRWAGEGAAGHEAEAVVASGDAAANPDEVEVDDEEEGGQEEEGSINVPLDEIAFADDVTVAWEKAKRDYSDCIRIIGETYPTAASFLKRLGGLGFELSGLLKEGEDGDAISSEVSLAPCPCEAHFTAHTQHIHSTYTGHTPHIHILRECVYAGKPMCV